MERRIRVQALALIRRGDRILVETGRDEVKDETFFRLLGGTVEFGETGAETVRREFLEELGTALDVGRLVATIENLFTYEGEPAHEICLVYACSLRDERLYALDEWDAHEETAGGVGQFARSALRYHLPLPTDDTVGFRLACPLE